MTDHEYRQAQYDRIRRLQEFADSQSVEIAKLREHAESEADVIAGLRDDLETARREHAYWKEVAADRGAHAVSLVLQLEASRKDVRQLRAEAAATAAAGRGAECHCGLCKPTILPFSR